MNAVVTPSVSTVGCTLYHFILCFLLLFFQLPRTARSNFAKLNFLLVPRPCHNSKYKKCNCTYCCGAASFRTSTSFRWAECKIVGTVLPQRIAQYEYRRNASVVHCTSTTSYYTVQLGADLCYFSIFCTGLQLSHPDSHNFV